MHVGYGSRTEIECDGGVNAVRKIALEVWVSTPQGIEVFCILGEKLGGKSRQHTYRNKRLVSDNDYTTGETNCFETLLHGGRYDRSVAARYPVHCFHVDGDFLEPEVD